MPGRSGLLAALCFLLCSNRTRTSNKSSSFAAIFFVFRVMASVKLYLTISAAYAAYSGSFFLCSYLLYKNEVTLTKNAEIRFNFSGFFKSVFFLPCLHQGRRPADASVKRFPSHMQVPRDYNPRFRQSYRRGSFALLACIYNMLKKIKSVTFFTNFFKKNFEESRR